MGRLTSDLYARQFRTAIQNYRLKDEVEVTLVVPVILEDPELYRRLRHAIGVCLPVRAEYGYAGCRTGSIQRSPDDAISRSPEATIPGLNWHLNSQMVIRQAMRLSR